MYLKIDDDDDYYCGTLSFYTQ